MQLNKYREGRYFTVDAKFHSKLASHNAFTNKLGEIEQIINAHFDTLKIKLDAFIEANLIDSEKKHENNA